MIIVKNSIISDDVADQHFACNLSCCRGACCIEGDSGAPLLESEVPVLKACLPSVLPLLTDEGRLAIEQQGVAVRDADGDLGTPLVAGGACAYITYAPDGAALCAIEKASHEGLIGPDFPKPVSCHLYPLRIDDYGEFTAVNYHRWDICREAAGHGQPLYIALREPLIRRFGSEWYDELLAEIDNRNANL